MKVHSIYISTLYLFIFSYALINSTYAAGKIFTKSEADSLYGPVRISKEIKTEQLRYYCQQTSKYLMFSIFEGKLYILGDNRKNLYSEGTELKADQVVQLFSLNIVEELLNKGENSITKIEQRDSDLTISNGNFTLDLSSGCPPNCSPDE